MFFGYLKNEKLQPHFTFWLDCIVFADWQMTRDEFEKKIADDFVNQDMVVKFNQTSQMVLKTQVLADENGDDSFCDLFQGKSTQCEPHLYQSPAIVADQDNRYRIYDFSSLLKITNLLTCPYFSFDNLQYSVTPGFIDHVVSLNLDGFNVTFSKNSELKMLHVESEGKLIVCKELLNAKINDIEMRNFGFQNNEISVPDDLTKIALYLCTLCSFGASILCLILTLASYLRFSFLRTVAGNSNMFLCVSLMIAQTLLLASSHV